MAYPCPELHLASTKERSIRHQCEEEVVEVMGEPTMEEYMTKTREDYGSVDRIIKMQKVLGNVYLFHIPEVTQDQIMPRAFPMSLPGAANRWVRNKPAGLIITWETLKTKFLSKYCPPARTAKKMEEINKYAGSDLVLQRIGSSKGAIPTMKAADAKKAIQDMADHPQKWHNGTSTRTRSTITFDELAAIQTQLNNLGKEIKKVNEREYVAQVGCESCNVPHYTKDCPLKEEGNIFKEAYYTQFRVPFPQGGRYRATALGFYQRDDGNPSYQEQRQTMEELLSKIIADSAKRHDENSNLIKEIQAATDVAIRNQGASIKCLENQIGQMSKELATIKRPKGIAKNVLVGIDKFIFPLDFVVLDMPEDIKVPLILGRPFLSTTHAKIDVLKRKISLRVGDDKIVFKSDKATSNIINRVYALGLRERMELDLEARLTTKALILNRSLDLTYGDYVIPNT
ncbi:ribonuclease H-like domain-containing protein [Tanacetum coccineum]